MSRVALALLLLAFCGCQREEEVAQPSVEVGVFFGGQIQRVKKVEVPPVRAPKIGFRFERKKGAGLAPHHEPIHYEIVRPGPEGRRVTEKGQLELPEGQTRLDHVIELNAASKLGVWNVRVVQGETLLADRALYLVAGAAGAP